MIEKIYTIPVNEAFDLYSGCPVCSLYKKLEDNEVDIMLNSGALMEPPIRLETNKKGFCGRHLDIMVIMKNRLGLALMIESHLSQNINRAITGGLFDFPGKTKKLDKQAQSCYVCGRIENSLGKMIETAALLWVREKEFKEKLLSQPYFCVRHYADLLQAGERVLPKKSYSDFAYDCRKVMIRYSEKLLEDVSWFVKKFDYNYQDEPWGDAKDAVERAIKFLCEYKHLAAPKK